MAKLMTKYMTKLMTNRQAINDQFWSCNKRPQISHQRSPNQKWSLICGFWSFFWSLIFHFPLLVLLKIPLISEHLCLSLFSQLPSALSFFTTVIIKLGLENLLRLSVVKTKNSSFNLSLFIG